MTTNNRTHPVQLTAYPEGLYLLDSQGRLWSLPHYLLPPGRPNAGWRRINLPDGFGPPPAPVHPLPPEPVPLFPVPSLSELWARLKAVVTMARW